MKKLIKELRNNFNVDFRRDKYISNSYNLSPVMRYARAIKIVKFVENYYKDTISFNTVMSVEKLRIMSLLNLIRECDFNNKVIKELKNGN